MSGDGSSESVVKDNRGRTCQLVTPVHPGSVGASVSVSGYVAYVSPGTPPINRIATAAYAANDH